MQKILTIILLLTIWGLHAQTKIGLSVVTNGGGTIGNSAYRINSSVGQTFTGKISAQNYQLAAGFWAQWNNSDPSSISEEQELSYQLMQNYPNPFNPSTTISFTLPEQQMVSVKIYDALGREVREIINSTLAKGVHQVNFKADNLTSGQYFYRIQAGNFRQVKKMMVLK